MRIATLGIMMHMAPVYYAGMALPGNSIIAGCTQSTDFVRALMYIAVKEHLSRCPQQRLRTYIDDLSQRFYGKTDDVQTHAVLAGADIAVRLTGLGCTLNKAKSVFIAKSPSDAGGAGQNRILRPRFRHWGSGWTHTCCTPFKQTTRFDKR